MRSSAALEEIGRSRERLLLMEVEMIDRGYKIQTVEALHVNDDFRQHFAEGVSDRNQPRFIKFRGLNM
ncbi:hypothetical protein ASF14_19215 [Sphingomonas sp. Leaf257]|nr:hypothetical protein ASF14_19215 [Sphingomonas sp. Leaf257]